MNLLHVCAKKIYTYNDTIFKRGVEMNQPDLTDIEILVLCSLWNKVGFATGKKPANIRFDTIYRPIKNTGIRKSDVKEALKELIKKGLARKYEKRNTYTLTPKGAILASKICSESWDRIRDKYKHR